jgi:LuxR family transcriptional regulator, maltose regulon positive regulatory protein
MVMIRPPQSRSGAVRRWNLLVRLARLGGDVRLVQVVAPPGYGKTTALAQWAEVDGRQFGWVQLDDSDNDPATLLAHIAAAAPGDRLEAAVSAVVADVKEGRTADATTEFARLLGAGEAGVLVLDDLHVLRRSAALQVVVGLAAALPLGWLLATASQRQPRMRTGRLRSHGQLVEFGPADLAFDTGETGDLLRRLGVGLPDSAVRGIVAHTEGWPAGVYLAGLSLVGQPDPAEAAAQITGSSRYIVDYFLDEVLTRQSAPTVRFLLRTSVLDRVCESLCDAVLDTTGSAAWLTEIQALNLFIVPEDDQGEWYRYHRLFAEMLQSELRRREPAEEDRVRRRASAWYEEQGRPDQAIRYALAGRDQAGTARMITAYAQRFNSEGRTQLVRDWLDALDEQVVPTYPPLAAMAAWIWALTGDGPRALWALRLAESASYDGPMPDGSASLESAVRRARAGLAPQGLEVMRTDAEEAVRLEPPGSPWYTMAALLLGTASMLLGDREVAVRELERAARLGRDSAVSGSSFALAQRALLAADEGDWPTATACAYDARALVDSAGLQTAVTSLPTYVACAHVRLHRGSAQLAGIDTAIGLRLFRRPSPAAFPWLGAQMAIRLGRLLLDLGDHTGAELKALEARRYLSVLGEAAVLQDQHLQLVALLDRTATRAATEFSTLTAAELRILPLLPTHLSLAEIAQQLVLSRNTVKTQVAAIYRKLEASNRNEAVRRANDLGLLDR